MKIIPTTQWLAVIELYENWLRGAGLPESTVKIRQYQLRRFAVTIKLPPESVTLEELSRYLATPTWGPCTRRSVRSTLKTFFRFLFISDRIGRNPAEFLPSVSAPLGRPRPAAENVIAEALLLADERVTLMIRLGANVGLRCCEIAAVHSSHLTRSPAGWSLRVNGKGSKVRVVPVSDSVAQAIIDRGEGYLFPGQLDGHLSAAYVSKLISRHLPPGVTAHQLRHRFASKAFRGDFNIRAVQELLGHASVVTTQIYTQVDDEDLRIAARAAA